MKHVSQFVLYFEIHYLPTSLICQRVWEHIFFDVGLKFEILLLLYQSFNGH